MKLSIVSATGNTFALVDAIAEPAPERAAELAIAVCAASGRTIAHATPACAGRLVLEARFDEVLAVALDGLLLLAPAEQGGDVRMILYNADGSRPEACGNGLRCVARAARERGHVELDAFLVETDGGLRRVELLEDGAGRRVRVSMGPPRVVDREALLRTSEGEVRAVLVDMGNPHCVVFVPDADRASVETLGPELERHARFPARTNVEFASSASGRLALRVWERGVGETLACGSGACAAAVAARATGRADLPVVVQLRGGELFVEWDGAGEVFLTGDVRELARGEWLEERGDGPLLFPHALAPARVREQILALALRHGLRVEEDDGASTGKLSKVVPHLGTARVSYKIEDGALEVRILERPRGLSDDLVRRMLAGELEAILR